jgi:pentatricopeptide repeat protein
MGVANTVTNSGSVPVMQRLSGPPAYILFFAVALEAFFWAFDVQVQFVEVWIVVLVVPLALSLAKPTEDVPRKHPAKKVIEDGRPQDIRKKVPQAGGNRKPAPERAPATQNPADTERNAKKAQIDSAVKEGKLEEAEALLAELVDASNADAVSYNMLISACSKQGKSDRARYWMQQMLKKDVKPDVASFNSIIDSCARSGDLAGANKWLTHMREVEVAPNTITYNALINTCAKLGDV